MTTQAPGYLHWSQQQTQILPARSEQVVLRQAIRGIARDNVDTVSLDRMRVNTREALDQGAKRFFEEIGIFVGDRLSGGVRLIEEKRQRHHYIIFAARGAPDIVDLRAEFFLLGRHTALDFVGPGVKLSYSGLTLIEIVPV